MRKWLTVKNGLLLLIVLVGLTGGLSYALTEVIREVRASLIATLPTAMYAWE